MTGKNSKNSSGGRENERDAPPDQSVRSTHQVRLPGFITGDEIGLGDVVKRTTSYLGIQSCGNCERRAARLNRWLVFTSGRSKAGGTY
jgi:hypothetical protein